MCVNVKFKKCLQFEQCIEIPSFVKLVKLVSHFIKLVSPFRECKISKFLGARPQTSLAQSILRAPTFYICPSWGPSILSAALAGVQNCWYKNNIGLCTYPPNPASV